jgi:hypothetical protein
MLWGNHEEVKDKRVHNPASISPRTNPATNLCKISKLQSCHPALGAGSGLLNVFFFTGFPVKPGMTGFEIQVLKPKKQIRLWIYPKVLFSAFRKGSQRNL